MNTQITTEFRPHVAVINGAIKTTSLKVAEHFEKNHYDVLRAIKNLECSQDFNDRNFAFVEYTDAKGEKRPAYEMTKDGFSFLAMGFTGAKAAQWKEAYINAFNAMADSLAHRGNTIDLSLTLPIGKHRYLITSIDGELRMNPVDDAAYVLTAEQIKNNLTDILPNHRLMDRQTAILVDALRSHQQGEATVFALSTSHSKMLSPLVVEALKTHGGNTGLTMQQIKDKCYRFRQSDKDAREKVLNLLEEAGEIQFVKIGRKKLWRAM